MAKQKQMTNFKVITSLPDWVEGANQVILAGSSNKNAVEAYSSSAWAFRAVSIRADAVTSAPLKLYDKKNQEIEKHPLLDLLAQVNNEWNKGDLWRYTESAICVYGSAYWQKVRAGKRIVELYFMNPKDIKVNQESGGITGFTQNFSGGKTFPREDVVYYKGSYDPLYDLVGKAPLAMGNLAAVGELKADQYLAAFFANYAVPPLVLSTEQLVTEALIEQVRTWWYKMFGGMSNRFKTGVIGNGLKPIPLSTNINDMAMDKTRTEFHRTICVSLGVDELLLSSTGAADRTPVDAALYHLYTTTIIPRWIYYEEVLNSELLPEYPDLVKKGAYLKFDQGEVKPLQDDQNEYANVLATLVEKKIIKPEVAAEELGFDEDDVPGFGEEPGEQENAIPTVLPGEGTLPPGNPTVLPSPEVLPPIPNPTGLDSIMNTELNKWRKKAINALGNGSSPAVEFDSYVLDNPIKTKILTRLEGCNTELEITKMFDKIKLELAGEDSFMILAQAINRATNVLLETTQFKGE